VVSYWIYVGVEGGGSGGRRLRGILAFQILHLLLGLSRLLCNTESHAWECVQVQNT